MSAVIQLAIPADHPAFAGHFPGSPVLPGAVLLDEALRALQLALGLAEPRWQIAAAKFLKPVRPGETLTLEHEQGGNGSIRFSIRTTHNAVASGVLMP